MYVAPCDNIALALSIELLQSGWLISINLPLKLALGASAFLSPAPSSDA